MKKRNHKATVLFAIIGSFVLLMAGATGVVLMQKFMQHELSQNERLLDVEARIGLLEAKDRLTDAASASDITGEKIWRGGYNYLAIGNSITIHPLADSWWNECGMAASSPEKDYYHLVKAYLESAESEVNGYALNFSIWETLYTDRAETLTVLDHYLNESLDLITVQLGENAQNLDTFESDFAYLLNHIQESAPHAEIIVIGDFWEYENRDAIKEKVSEKCNVRYISLSEIKDNKVYQCGLGTTVYGSEGEPHTVEHGGVAAHPNDKAMEFIADKIIKLLSN